MTTDTTDTITRIGYMFRDTSNNKQFGLIVLAGELTAEVAAELNSLRAGYNGEGFCPDDLELPGIEPLEYSSIDGLSSWHEIDFTEARVTTNAPRWTHATVEQFADAFRSAAAEGWPSGQSEDDEDVTDDESPLVELVRKLAALDPTDGDALGALVAEARTLVGA